MIYKSLIMKFICELKKFLIYIQMFSDAYFRNRIREIFYCLNIEVPVNSDTRNRIAGELYNAVTEKEEKNANPGS